MSVWVLSDRAEELCRLPATGGIASPVLVAGVAAVSIGLVALMWAYAPRQWERRALVAVAVVGAALACFMVSAADAASDPCAAPAGWRPMPATPGPVTVGPDSTGPASPEPSTSAPPESSSTPTTEPPATTSVPATSSTSSTSTTSTIPEAPAVTLRLLAAGADANDPVEVRAGNHADEVVWRWELANTGNVTLAGIELANTDASVGALLDAVVGSWPGSLEAGESIVFESPAQRYPAGGVTLSNTATVTALSPAGTTVSASDPATIATVWTVPEYFQHPNCLGWGVPVLGDASAGSIRPNEVRQIGTSAEGRPIWAEHYGPMSGPQTIVVAYVHGNECTPGFMVETVRSEVPAGFGVWLIPTLNPDGQHAFTRNNAQEVNINRDGGQRLAPETNALLDFTAEVQPVFNIHAHSPYGWMGWFGWGEVYNSSMPGPSGGRLPYDIMVRANELLGEHWMQLRGAGANDPDEWFLWQGQLAVAPGTSTVLIEFHHLDPAETVPHSEGYPTSTPDVVSLEAQALWAATREHIGPDTGMYASSAAWTETAAMRLEATPELLELAAGDVDVVEPAETVADPAITPVTSLAGELPVDSTLAETDAVASSVVEVVVSSTSSDVVHTSVAAGEAPVTTVPAVVAEISVTVTPVAVVDVDGVAVATYDVLVINVGAAPVTLTGLSGVLATPVVVEVAQRLGPGEAFAARVDGPLDEAARLVGWHESTWTVTGEALGEPLSVSALSVAVLAPPETPQETLGE